MSGDIFFTTTEVAQQLNVGVSTVKVWSKRYSKWLPATAKNNEIVFPQKTLETFQLISECTASGMESESIETVLDDTIEEIPDSHNDSNVKSKPPEPEKNDPPKSNNSIFNNMTKGGIDDILLEILNQQKKIASAQDRRATAEERKAFAQESRAEAELLKANVMQEMLTVIKEQSVQTTVSSLMDRIRQMPGPSPSELDFDFNEKIDELQELTESIPEETQPEPPLSTESPEISENEITTPLPEVNETAKQEPLVTEKEISSVQQEDIDDLSQLIEQPVTTEAESSDDIDDLSLLIESDTSEQIDDMDDLSLLIDDVSTAEAETTGNMDDLAALLDKPVKQTVDDDIDDLSLLVSDSTEENSADIDDLSQLIDEKPKGQQDVTDSLSTLVNETADSTSDDVDDLSLLIDAPAEPVKEKVQEKPASTGDHKSQVLSKIIKMKEKDGLSIEEATQKLNDEGIKTLSGKGDWDTKTITGIYKYIDSGKEKK